MGNNRAEYLALTRLMNNPDYQILEALWLHHLSSIEKSRDSAASRGNESAWRYWAGQEKGAKQMMMALSLAIKDMESKGEEEVEETKYENLLEEIRGNKK